MLTVEFKSLSGQYHATPWDHQVNEGVIEWPPSPWRIVRALIATRHLKARDEVSELMLASIVEKLSEELPRYMLPSMVEAHTRHYMPLRDAGKTTKIFQAFARIGEDPIVVRWLNVSLTTQEDEAAHILFTRMSFLGRAESWIEARILNDEEFDWNCGPIGPSDNGESVRVLAPAVPSDYLKWRTETLTNLLSRRLAELQRKDIDKGKAPTVSLTKRQVADIEKSIPASIVDALCCDTSDLKKAGWSQPPGARWVAYDKPPDSMEVVQRSARRPDVLPTVARFAVASAVLPRLTDAIYEAEKLHQSLVKWSDGASVFTGCDAQRQRLEGHRHAYILPESHDGQGHITHFTVYAQMGFDYQARSALEHVRRLWGRQGHDLQLVLIGIGKPSDFAGWNTTAGACPLFVESTVWRSRTPFVSTRHIRRSRNGKPQRDEQGLVVGSPEHDLRRLLRLQGLNPIEVVEIESTFIGKDTRWLVFNTERKKGHARRGSHVGTGFQITFDEPIQGPIVLGAEAHFGVGQFVPIKVH